ncbi:hypothetical protein [Clostridium sp.]|uniref:hypothetical protein n=1 Tax=Clostridium sp. TaxID=1506 RepID=UPI003F2B851B
MSKKIKTTITLSAHIKEFASNEAKALGLDFSAYMSVLIAEKMRGITLAPPINNTTQREEAILEPKITPKEIIVEIDSSQESEIDRLLEM